MRENMHAWAWEALRARRAVRDGTANLSDRPDWTLKNQKKGASERSERRAELWTFQNEGGISASSSCSGRVSTQRKTGKRRPPMIIVERADALRLCVHRVTGEWAKGN
jgi:hypothetical protein